MTSDKKPNLRLFGVSAVIGLIFIASMVSLMAMSDGKASSENGNESSSSVVSSSTNVTVYTTSSLGYPQIRDVNYCTIGGFPEYLYITYPQNHSAGIGPALPVVVYVHGGGWINGSYTYDYQGMFESFLNNSFIVVSVGYYLPNNQLSQPPPAFPLNIEDVSCAIRFLRANAQQYGVNPNEIGIFGDSSGANLAVLEALAALNGTYDNFGQWQGYSDRVQAVGDLFGPMNLTSPLFLQDSQITSYRLAGGLNLTNYVWNGNMTLLYQNSPVNYIANDDPPIMIQQGWDDIVVVPSTSIAFYNDLIVHCDQAQIIMVYHMGHAYFQDGPNPIDPSLPTLIQDLFQFFETNLSNSSTSSVASSSTSCSSSSTLQTSITISTNSSSSIVSASSLSTTTLTSTTTSTRSSYLSSSLGPIILAIVIVGGVAMTIFLRRRRWPV